MQLEPSISILIPCYNKEGLIRQVVETAMDQSRPPDEIIVVDDCSTDHSVEILQQLPVKLIQHEYNLGPANARNSALQAAHGDIVIYVDADAFADQHMVEQLLLAYQHPKAATLGGVGGRGIETHLQNEYDRWRAAHARQDFGATQRDNVPYLFGLCMSFKREVIQKIGGFDAYFPINAGEDLEIGYRFKRNGYWLRYTPFAIVHHQHSDDAQKLKTIQYNWYYWSYLAKKRSGVETWSLYTGTIRRLFTDTLADLILRRDSRLAQIDLQIFPIKIKALRDAARITA